MKISLYHETEIIDSCPLAAGEHKLTLKAPQVAAESRAGQFVHLLLPGEGQDPFLRRPFSIASASSESGTIQLFFRLVGRGTRTLSAMDEGTKLNCLGPLGRGFSIPRETEIPLLIAGGIGAAPLWFLKQSLEKGNIPFHFFWGAASKDSFFLLEDLVKDKKQLHLATDDGSLGFYGPVTSLLEKRLRHLQDTKLHLYSCGPAAMLKKVQEIAGFYRIPHEVSLEERMACGVGACLGCAVAKQGEEKKIAGEEAGFARVCVDGPVFPGEEVVIDG